MDDETEMIEVYRCQNCTWEGEADQLVDENDNGKFDQCPWCKGTEFDIEEEEEGYFG